MSTTIFTVAPFSTYGTGAIDAIDDVGSPMFTTIEAANGRPSSWTPHTHAYPVVHAVPPPGAPPGVPTVVALTTDVTGPLVSGTFDATTARNMVVEVGGVGFALGYAPELTSIGGVWSLDLSSHTLTPGVYDVMVSVEDDHGRVVSDATTDELEITGAGGEGGGGLPPDPDPEVDALLGGAGLPITAPIEGGVFVSTPPDVTGAPALHFQWVRGSEDIVGATAPFYYPSVLDAGEVLHVRTSYNGVSFLSAPSLPVVGRVRAFRLASGGYLKSATPIVEQNGPFTVCGWMYVQNYLDDRTVFSASGEEGVSWRRGVRGGRTRDLVVHPPLPGFPVESGEVDPRTWRFFAYTAAGGLSVDGVPITPVDHPLVPLDPSGGFVFGSNGWEGSHWIDPFEGKLADLRIYSTNKTPAELVSISLEDGSAVDTTGLMDRLAFQGPEVLTDNLAPGASRVWLVEGDVTSASGPESMWMG